jgi:hypothetical protein
MQIPHFAAIISPNRILLSEAGQNYVPPIRNASG